MSSATTTIESATAAMPIKVLFTRIALVSAALIVAAVILCRAHYYSVKDIGPVVVAQVSVADFRPEFVRTYRVPYILEERLPGLAGLLSTAFRWQTISQRSIAPRYDEPFTSRGMYTFIHSMADQQYADIRAPTSSAAATAAGTTTRVRLCRGRVMILPPHWQVSLSSNHGGTQAAPHDAMFRGNVLHAFDLTSFLATLFVTKATSQGDLTV